MLQRPPIIQAATYGDNDNISYNKGRKITVGTGLDWRDLRAPETAWALQPITLGVV